MTSVSVNASASDRMSPMNHMFGCQPSDVLDDESSLSMSGSASLSGADRAVGSVAEALSEYENHENVANFRTLLRRVLNGGHSIDMKMANDQTLLHHAVSLDLVKEVLRILNCGAILVENKYGKTPLDVALERGNQILLQVLNRSADYQNYVKEKFGDTTLPKVRMAYSNRKIDSTADTIFGQHKYGWSQYELDRKTNKLVQSNSHMRCVVYDDYLDWTGSQKAKHQEVRHHIPFFNELIFMCTL